MEEQAGIYRIILYENKELQFIFSETVDNTIINILNTTTTITLENSDDDTIDLGYTFEHQRSGNNRLLYKNTITWKQLDLFGTNLALIDTLKQSIYGWIPLIEFYNGDLKVIENPFIFTNAAIDNNISNHYNIELKNAVYGKRIKDYSPLTGEIITADNNVITADSDKVDASGGVRI